MTRPTLLKRLRARLASGGAPKVDPADQAPGEAWQAALDGEVGFWRNWFVTKGERFPGTYETRLDPDLPLQPEIADLIGSPAGATVHLLDVGAGPLTYFGRKDPRWTLDITAVDALGDRYAALMAELGVTPPVPTEACETEHLSDRFAPDTFDVVAARNTLDHSYDPLLAIEQMLHCAKPASALLLVHRRNEAEREHYHGMHQWNFEADDSRLVIWRGEQRTDLGEHLGDRARIERTWNDGPWEHVVIRKASAPATN